MDQQRPARRLTRRPLAVDLHCHILPALDDGAADLADAVAMARQAEDDGIALICATPHIRDDHLVPIRELAGRVADLNERLEGAGATTRVLPGGEVSADVVGRLSDDELTAVSLGGAGRWILLEPSPGPIDDRLIAAHEALVARGRGAVIAHPERHLGPDLIDRLSALIGRGALVQATADSFTASESRGGMVSLARAGVVHVLGTDAHSARHGRPVTASGALAALASVSLTADHLEWIARTAPWAIVHGRPLTPPFPPGSRSSAGR